MDAHSIFYKENRDRLYAYLLRMTGDRHLAADLVQESFVRYLRRYTHRNHSKSLLYTIARNAALDALRGQKANAQNPDDSEDPYQNPEKQIMNRESLSRVLTAIGQLSQPHREIISLVTSEDLNYREIGDILNISEANVKVRVHRARKRLQEILSAGEK